MSEDEDELHPPPPERVRRRALVLSAVVCRGSLERDAGSADAEEFREKVSDWLRGSGAWMEAEPEEQRFLDTPLGDAEPRSVVDATWRSEGLAVLAWALGAVEMIAHDEAVNPRAAAGAVGFMQEPGRLVLRSSEEITAMSERLFAIHWRLREYSLCPNPIDFKRVADSCWFGPLLIEGVALVNGDLSVRGSAIADAAPENIRICTSIARERHQASNWLIGRAELYSDVDTGT